MHRNLCKPVVFRLLRTSRLCEGIGRLQADVHKLLDLSADDTETKRDVHVGKLFQLSGIYLERVLG